MVDLRIILILAQRCVAMKIFYLSCYLSFFWYQMALLWKVTFLIDILLYTCKQYYHHFDMTSEFLTWRKETISTLLEIVESWWLLGVLFLVVPSSIFTNLLKSVKSDIIAISTRFFNVCSVWDLNKNFLFFVYPSI